MGGDHCGHQVFCFLITKETQSGGSRLGSIQVGKRPGAAAGQGPGCHTRRPGSPLWPQKEDEGEHLFLHNRDYAGVAFHLLILPLGDKVLAARLQGSERKPLDLPSGLIDIAMGVALSEMEFVPCVHQKTYARISQQHYL